MRRGSRRADRALVEADALCRRLAIIDHGRSIALGTPAELKASVPGGFVLRLRFGRRAPDLLQRLQSLAGVREVRSLDVTKNEIANGALPHGAVTNDAIAHSEPANRNSIDVYADRGGSLISEIANLASAASVELCDVHISEPSLENLFLHHTGRSMRE